jgi:hypothetical protein
LKQEIEETSPGKAQGEPGSETAMPYSPHSTQERPRRHINICVGDMNVPSRITGPRGHLGVEWESGGVKVDWGRRKVIEGARYDGICPRSEANKHVDEMNMSHRDRGPEGHLGE